MFQIREDIQTLNQKHVVPDNELHFLQMFDFPIKEKELMKDIDNYLSIDNNYQQSVSCKTTF